ncbi:hypothetical protein [Actinacidiphila glaucinigra]|uniref:hypothetical protein n=1 Tax=Actinacidiphila glaucinigra TaxID=235986 RepID=UPI002E34563E|nr:hypothetical protein [Actinacidiphila glaucinigra]
MTAEQQPTAGAITAPARPARPCTHWIGTETRHCGATEDVRHYLPGMRCPQHTPAALAGRAEPQPGPGIPAYRQQTTNEARPVTSWRDVNGALYVDLEGIRARYECLLCRTTEGPVYGTEEVAEFATGIRTSHRSRCAAPQESRS